MRIVSESEIFVYRRGFITEQMISQKLKEKGIQVEVKHNKVS